MPYLTPWRKHFQTIFNAIVEQFPDGVPDGVDWERLREIEDLIQYLWSSDDATWEEWQVACGQYKMFWWKLKKG